MVLVQDSEPTPGLQPASDLPGAAGDNSAEGK